MWELLGAFALAALVFAAVLFGTGGFVPSNLRDNAAHTRREAEVAGIAALAVPCVMAGYAYGWLVLSMTSSLAMHAMSYAVVGAFLYYLLAPHPSASLAHAHVSRQACRRADWTGANWRAVVEERTPRTGLRYAVFAFDGVIARRVVHTLLMRGEARIRVALLESSHAQWLRDTLSPSTQVEFVMLHDRLVAESNGVVPYDFVLDAVRDSHVVLATLFPPTPKSATDAAYAYHTNVRGTEQIIKACQECGVRALVHATSSSVSVASGRCTLAMNEKVPLVSRSSSPSQYGWTAAVAETLVLHANGVRGVGTVAIRPCSRVFGLGDLRVVEPLVLLGHTVLPPNGGSPVVDFVSAVNVAWAMLLAERALVSYSPDQDADDLVRGETFCVSNNHPMRLLDLCGIVNELRPGGLRVVPVPQRMMAVLAYGMQLAHFVGIPVPTGLSNFAARSHDQGLDEDLCYAFSSKKAEARLGYHAVLSVEQAVQLSVEEWARGNVMLPSL